MRLSRGTVMLALLVTIVVGGLVAVQLIPGKEVQERRRSEQGLRSAISEIRQAFDMKEVIAGSFAPDLSTPAKINAILKQLEAEGLLRNASLTDETLFSGQWGPASGAFWIGATNIPFNTSFEASVTPDVSKSEFVASWSLGTADTVASLDPVFWPSRDTDIHDDYWGQNKFGKLLQVLGNSLKITR